MPRGRRRGIAVARVVQVREQWKRVIKYVCVCFSLSCLRPWVEGIWGEGMGGAFMLFRGGRGS